MQCNGPHSFGRSQHNPSSSTVSVVVVDVIVVVVFVVVVVVVPSCCNEPHSYDRSQNPSSSTVSVVVVVVIVVVIVVVVVVFPSCCNEPHSYDRSQIPSTPIVFVVIVVIVLVLSPPCNGLSHSSVRSLNPCPGEPESRTPPSPQPARGGLKLSAERGGFEEKLFSTCQSRLSSHSSGVFDKKHGVAKIDLARHLNCLKTTYSCAKSSDTEL